MTELLNYKIRLDKTRDSLIRIKSIINTTYNKIEDDKKNLSINIINTKFSF